MSDTPPPMVPSASKRVYDLFQGTTDCRGRAAQFVDQAFRDGYAAGLLAGEQRERASIITELREPKDNICEAGSPMCEDPCEEGRICDCRLNWQGIRRAFRAIADDLERKP